MDHKAAIQELINTYKSLLTQYPLKRGLSTSRLESERFKMMKWALKDISDAAKAVIDDALAGVGVMRWLSDKYGDTIGRAFQALHDSEHLALVPSYVRQIKSSYAKIKATLGVEATKEAVFDAVRADLIKNKPYANKEAKTADIDIIHELSKRAHQAINDYEMFRIDTLAGFVVNGQIDWAKFAEHGVDFK